MEILVVGAVIGYIIYLRYYADTRTNADRERDQLAPGIDLFRNGQLQEAYQFFDQKIRKQPRRSVAYLYRARCLRELGDPAAARKDLDTGLSYDNTVADLYLEKGQLFDEQGDYEAALTEFDRAVLYDRGRRPKPLRCRAKARQRLGQLAEAEQDLARADELEALAREQNISPEEGPFFDQRFWVNTALVVVNSAVLLFVVKRSPVVHWPYLLATVSAAAIGFAEPRKGWVLALLQALLLWSGYTFFTEAPTTSGQRELEAFNLYGAIGLTFVSSFMGGVLKRSAHRSRRPADG